MLYLQKFSFQRFMFIVIETICLVYWSCRVIESFKNRATTERNVVILPLIQHKKHRIYCWASKYKDGTPHLTISKISHWNIKQAKFTYRSIKKQFYIIFYHLKVSFVWLCITRCICILITLGSFILCKGTTWDMLWIMWCALDKTVWNLYSVESCFPCPFRKVTFLHFTLRVGIYQLIIFERKLIKTKYLPKWFIPLNYIFCCL